MIYNRRFTNMQGVKGMELEVSIEDLLNKIKMKQVLKQSDYDKLYVVIQKLASEKNITIQEVMTLTGKSRTTAWRYMKKLTDTKLVEAYGNTNDAVYTVVEA